MVLPIPIDLCRKAAFYSVMKRTQQETKNGDGFEYLKTHDFEVDGKIGHYIERVLHFKRQIPSYLRWSLPDKYAHLHEVNTNCFPHTKAVFTIEGMGEDFLLITETMYTEIDKSTFILPENPVNLNEEELKLREIVYIDILNGPLYKKEFDLHGFSCPEAGISELTASDPSYNQNEIPKWALEYPGTLTLCTKVIRFLFRWKGLQTIVENLVANTVWYRVYSDSHRAMVLWSPEWFKMSNEDMLKMEGNIKQELSEADIDKN